VLKRLILSVILTTSILMASDITVEIIDLSNKNGDVKIGLYNKAEDFSKVDKAYKLRSIKILSKTVKYKFTNIPNGTYAIAVFHDENQNDKVDKIFLGIPSEGYGFSNNIRPSFRSANFEESKFELNKNEIIIIKMGY
jgi:uncharacterized protein (DUF2141 family)